MIIKTFFHQKAIFTSQGEVRASEMDLSKKKKSKLVHGAKRRVSGLCLHEAHSLIDAV